MCVCLVNCRHNYEAQFNPTENAEEPAKMTFADFVYLVLDGPMEYADFLEENEVDGNSLAVDTGSIDGEGVSAAWNPAGVAALLRLPPPPAATVHPAHGPL